MTFCGSAVDVWLKMGSRYVVCEILETTHLAASSSLLWSRTELKTPGGACPVCLSLLPANAPVPSNTDKYCPNPELSLYNRDCIGDFCCEWGSRSPLSSSRRLAVNLDEWLLGSPLSTNVRISYRVFGPGIRGSAVVHDLPLATHPQFTSATRKGYNGT